MYYNKLHKGPLHLWHLLTLTTLLFLVYQQGPGWIHQLHRQGCSQDQIQTWIFMHELLNSEGQKYPRSLAICEIWLSVHGVEMADEKGMKGLGKKWTNIFVYWQGYERQK